MERIWHHIVHVIVVITIDRSKVVDLYAVACMNGSGSDILGAVVTMYCRRRTSGKDDTSRELISSG